MRNESKKQNKTRALTLHIKINLFNFVYKELSTVMNTP